MVLPFCRYCYRPIEYRTFALGGDWVHVGGMTGYYTHCQLTAATPTLENEQ